MNSDLDEDDAWSYSFPPSTESLPITDQNRKSANETSNGGSNGNPNDTSNEAAKDTITKKPNVTGGLTPIKVDNNTDDDPITTIAEASWPDVSSDSSSSSGEVLKIKTRKKYLQKLAPSSATSSLSSMSLQSPFLVKSTPANPYTTKEDANSIISKDSYQNALNNENAPNESSAFESMRTAIGSNLELQNSDATINEHRKTMSRSSVDSRLQDTPDGADTDSLDKSMLVSPKIIAYRKQSRRSGSNGGISNIENLISQADKYDNKLYVDEKFKDSDYRYAIMKRNIDFHQLFKSIDLTDRLLDDFACALSREILLQGRIYVSEHNICFNSNLLGWVTNLNIAMEDIIRFEKKTTAGLFPNGITIETKNTSYRFASFLSRDLTFDFMVTIWEGTTGRKMQLEETTSRGSEEAASPTSENSEKFNSYILSIDGDDEDDAKSNGTQKGVSNEEDSFSGSFMDEDEEEDVEDVEEAEEVEVDLDVEPKPEENGLVSISTKVLKFKDESKYVNMGPEIHPPTSVDIKQDPNERELCNEIIEAPIGIVYDILFGSNNTAFHKKFIEDHDGSDISTYNEYHPMEDDPTKLERKYSYKKALGYTIGPKSTCCLVSEVIQHLNFADYVLLTSTVSTPDVPSGNSFSVKTKYCLTWAANNSTNLVISYYIKWTGSSWVKSLVEKLTLAGQEGATRDLIQALRKEIEAETTRVDGPTLIKPTTVQQAKPESVSANKVKTKSRPKTTKKVETSAVQFFKENSLFVTYFLFFLILVLFVLQFQVYLTTRQTNKLIKSQLMVDTHIIQILNKGSFSLNQDPDAIWEWASNKFGKKFTDEEKTQYLAYQLSQIYQQPKQSKRFAAQKLSDIKRAVSKFKVQNYINVEGIRDAIDGLV